MERLPSWLKQSLPDIKSRSVSHNLNKFRVDTVCRQAKCPNINDCFSHNQVTFMILGNVCTRHCKFCNVEKNNAPSGIDYEEPVRIAEAVRFLKLKYAVITSVTRDDLSDGGSGQFVNVIEAIRRIDQYIKLELLIPDFEGNLESLKTVIGSKPFVLAHNLETVKSLYSAVRPEADYGRSLNLLKMARELDNGLITKSSLMLGFGESENEVIVVLKDLRKVHCDIVTLGQYLAPSLKHYPVKEYISPVQFQRYADIAKLLGFKKVLSGPKVRSSFRAEDLTGELKYA